MPGLHLQLQTRWPEDVLEIHNQHGDETAVVKKGSIQKIASFVREDEAFNMNVLMDLTAVDRAGMNERPRFEVVYHFYSLLKNHRLRIKVRAEERDPVVPTLTGVWPIADWFEREVWDMFGIRFEGHPNLKRILMYEEFSGHPLRKDYPYSRRQPLIGPKN